MAAPAAATSSSVSNDVAGDDLTCIEGINAEVEKLLKEQGLSRYSHIASLDEKDVRRLNRLLGIDRRVQRENWIGQARQLAGEAGSDTTDAVTETMHGDAHAPSAASTSTPKQDDDLKRIRGVGELIERKLKAMGHTSYADIANWSRADIDRVSHQLDFSGRIERENWVEQARILASGGQTEFSRRFDTGGA